MPSQRWKELEKTAAEILGGRRIVRYDFFESAPDVLVCDLGIIAECKTRRRFAHHVMLETAQSKYCKAGETAILVTKHEHQRGAYATVPLDMLAELLNLKRQRARGPLELSSCPSGCVGCGTGCQCDHKSIPNKDLQEYRRVCTGEIIHNASSDEEKQSGDYPHAQ